MSWIIPAWVLSLLVYVSLGLSALAPVILVILFIKDFKGGKLW